MHTVEKNYFKPFRNNFFMKINEQQIHKFSRLLHILKSLCLKDATFNSITDVTIAKYSNLCGNRGDFAVTPNKGNDDGNHPMYTKRVTFVDVAKDYRVKYWRSSIG